MTKGTKHINGEYIPDFILKNKAAHRHKPTEQVQVHVFDVDSERPVVSMSANGCEHKHRVDGRHDIIGECWVDLVPLQEPVVVWVNVTTTGATSPKYSRKQADVRAEMMTLGDRIGVFRIEINGDDYTLHKEDV